MKSRILSTQKLWKVRRFKNVIFGLLLLKSCLFFGQDFSDKKVIVIDPGHGGVDSGTVGINSIQEKDVVLDIAKKIIWWNKTLFDNQLNIHLSRYRDTLISLSDRNKLAKLLHADLFISLHCNHSPNPNAKGVEIYIYEKKNIFSSSSVWLAFNLLKRINEELGFKSRGVKFANFKVLRDAASFYPAVLMELGFLSNEDESEYFLNHKNTKALALAILMEIIEF